MRVTEGLAVIGIITVLAGCGSQSSPPTHSASGACKDFQSWFLSQGGNVLAGKDDPTLTHAVTQAPSGNLYRDLKVLKSDVATATADQGGSLGTGTKLFTIEAASAVEQDCQSVNPLS